MNATLVMQDFETDSYWSIMTNEAIEGEKKGTKLRELPVSSKVQWKEWVKKHPNTLVLSVDGKEDANAGYNNYFKSSEGFRGIEANDDRLTSKESIFAFEYENKKYAVVNATIEGGKVFDLGNIKIFLYRPEDVDIYYSTIAYQSTNSGFTKVENGWIEIDSECLFDKKTESFSKNEADCPKRFNGFDTFWYTWSLNNPDTELLGADSED